MRLTQSLFHEDEMRAQCFVDDPLMGICCTDAELPVIVTSTILVWRALGLPLAFNKAQLGSKITWIGGVFYAPNDRLEVSVKQAIVDDITHDFQNFARRSGLTTKRSKPRWDE
jgi:hypothetical protein